MRIALAIAMLVSLAPVTLADTIIADATGADSSFTTDFWGVMYENGDRYVESVTFDLSADSNAYFDFDGSSHGGATAPALGTLIGLSVNDITLTTSNVIGGNAAHPSLLTFTFAAKSFAAGDSFRFSADTDALGIGIPDPGSVIADSGVLFSVLYEDGLGGTTGYVSDSQDVAFAVLSTPEPGTWVLLTLAIGIFVWRRARCYPT